jgi:endoribonuclease Nob1
MQTDAHGAASPSKARKRTLVLDTSAILSGKPAPEGILYAPPGVIGEFEEGGKSRRQLDYMLEAGLRVIPPTPQSVAVADEAASRTGDIHKLSETDLEVLALAKDVHGCVVTDDYAIQNVAATLKIPFQPINQAGITQVVTWAYKCRGCGKQYQDLAKECTVCGSEVRAVKGK